jgi:thioredoxin reductase
MTDDTSADLPTVVVGAGPVGLAAAARLVERGLRPLVLERGEAVASAVRAWGHVRLFSPWRFNIDDAARALLDAQGWAAPEPDTLPTGAELAERYLEPLARHPEIAPHVVLGASVVAVGRDGLDKAASAGRSEAPFVVRWRTSGGAEQSVRARAVIDASGTWDHPNPMGTGGLDVPGERAAGDRIAYGIPDARGAERQRYAGRRVLVVGGGHSAINVVLDLLDVADAPGTEVIWALRRDGITRLLGGGLNDQLPERGALGLAADAAVRSGRVRLLAPFAATRIDATADGLSVVGTHAGVATTVEVDRIVVATGFRPGLEALREIRLALDPIVEAPPALAPLIDPNLHSCGTVPAHGFAELAHPEPGFFIVGAKSYGRAPTFLMATGYEQVRSVVAHLAGDDAAARDVRLVLPETGVCSGAPAGASEAARCCGGPAPADESACCMTDVEAKSAGKDGCGCGSSGACGPTVAPADALAHA